MPAPTPATTVEPEPATQEPVSAATDDSTSPTYYSSTDDGTTASDDDTATPSSDDDTTTASSDDTTTTTEDDEGADAFEADDDDNTVVMYEYIGCYSDKQEDRILGDMKTSDSMTADVSLAFDMLLLVIPSLKLSMVSCISWKMDTGGWTVLEAVCVVACSGVKAAGCMLFIDGRGPCLPWWNSTIITVS